MKSDIARLDALMFFFKIITRHCQAEALNRQLKRMKKKLRSGLMKGLKILIIIKIKRGFEYHEIIRKECPVC